MDLPSTVHIISILWTTATSAEDGNKIYSLYSEEDVNRLCSMIKRNTSFPVCFHLFSDEALPGLDPEIIRHPEPRMKIPPEFNRYAYRKEAALCDDTLGGLTGQRVFFFDLDVLITGNLDELFAYPEEDRFYIIKDWKSRDEAVGQATCYSFVVGTLGSIRRDFEADPHGFFKKFGTASQEYLSSKVIEKQGRLNFWPEAWFRSFRFHCMPPGILRWVFSPKRPPEKTKVLAFHGRPEIRDALAGRWSERGSIKEATGWKKLYKTCRPTPWIRDYWF